MEKFGEFITMLNGYLWGPWLLFLLIGTHIFMTVRTGFIQRKIGLAIKLSVTKDKDSAGDVSQFAALATALASTVGTGSIIGVGTAIALGGPGAVIWMWVVGMFGIATKYAESVIAVKYRVKDEDGFMLGGAMFALERGLKMKWLGVLFSFFIAVAAFGLGDSVQSNAIATLMSDNFKVPGWVSGLVLAVLAGVVLLGGIKRLSQVCEKFVPVMAIVYILGCIIILVMNWSYFVPAITVICDAAFNAKAVGGGFVASTLMTAMRYGTARGLFSNEAGMGSAPIVAAAAQTKNSVRTGLVSSTGVFWSTGVICLITGFVIVTSILKIEAAHAVDESILVSGNGGLIVQVAFSQIPVIGKWILVFGLFTFAFSTILGWSYYGEKGAEYLFGARSNIPYRCLYIIFTFLGAVASMDIVWNVADALNALMTIPNLIAVLLLSGVVARETKKYLNNIDLVDTTTIPLRMNGKGK